MKFPTMFSPIRIGTVTVPNRFVVPPMGNNFANTDGTLSGPSFERLQALQDTVGCDIISSGGISSNQDIAALHQMDLYGAIVGKAWYAGAVNLREAIREGGPQQ